MDFSPDTHNGPIFFRFDNKDSIADDSIQRKWPIQRKEEVWTIKSLDVKKTEIRGESKTVSRVQEFVRKMTENWQHKLQLVRDMFEETIAMIVQERLSEISYSTRSLKEELQETKDMLDNLETFDPEDIKNMKDAWFYSLYQWKNDMFRMEERSTKFLKTAVARYLSKLVMTRHNPCHTFDVMLTLVLELNQIIMGNVQAIIDVEHDLGLLWDTHFKDWCIAYYLRVGLDPSVLKDSEECDFKEEESVIEGLAALDSVLNLISSVDTGTTIKKEIKFNKSSQVMIPHLLYLESYWKSFREKEKNVMEVLEAEAQKMIVIKKFLKTIKPEDRAAFEAWLAKAGYGEDSEKKFIQTAEMVVQYIKELKILMLRTVEAWQDLSERLDAIKTIIEVIYDNQDSQIKAAFLEWEINMNMAVDELRQAHSLPILENLWNVQIDKLFLDYKSMLIEVLEHKKNILNMYAPMSKMTFRLFTASLEVLITESPNESSTNIPETSLSSNDLTDIQDSDFRLSETIISCISNARLGYIECLTFFKEEIETNIQKLGLEWVEKRKAELAWVLKIKEEMMIHRMHRMKIDVLDIRTAELRFHEETISRHTEAIREKLKQLSSLDITEGLLPMMEDFNNVAEEISTLNIKVNPGGFPRIIAKLDKAKEKFSNLCVRCDHDSLRTFEHIDRYYEWMEQINLQLVCDIRLFSEMGNFSADEVNGIIFILQRLEKEILNEKKSLDVKFSKGIILNDLDIGNKLEKFMHYMKKTQNELLHKSNMRLILNRAKRAIKREIFNGRVLLKTMESVLSSDQVQGTASLPQLLDVVKKACSFLAVPEDFVDLTGGPANIDRTSSIGHNLKVSTSGLKTFHKKASRNVHKSTHSLIVRLENDDDELPNIFLYKLFNIISKCKEALSIQIYKFSTQTVIRRSESNLWVPMKALIKAQSQKGNSFLQELESELNEIHYQCIIVWLDMVNEFMDLYFLFGNQVSAILNCEYKKFENMWISSMEVLENQFNKELNEFEQTSRKNKEEMKRRLKTMFGHPKHKERLAALTSEAVTFCKSQTQDLKKIILNRRSQIKQLLTVFLAENKPITNDLYQKVAEVYENAEVEHILYKLTHILINRSRSRKFMHNLVTSQEQIIRKNNPSGEEKPIPSESESIETSSVWRLTVNVPALTKSVILKLMKVISIRDDAVSINQDTVIDSQCDFGNEEPRDYGRLCKNLKMGLFRSAIKLCRMSKLALAVYLEEMQTWLSNWRTDCSRLTDLYTFSLSVTSKEKHPPQSYSHKQTPQKAISSKQSPLLSEVPHKSV